MIQRGIKEDKPVACLVFLNAKLFKLKFGPGFLTSSRSRRLNPHPSPIV